ncbi:formate dehydrogenase N subunit beta transmembrane domain-containing protein [Azotobacter chroococcum]|nr:formate dehydrogenase N subunit beta transmembrane domain-containing protein [Azotobacter chroococcum]
MFHYVGVGPNQVDEHADDHEETKA